MSTSAVDAAFPDDDRELLTASEGVLLRALNRRFIKDGVISLEAFKPIPQDEDEFSVDRGTLSSAEQTYQRRVERGRTSEGTWGFDIATVISAGSRALADPLPAEDGFAANPAHAIVDFRGLNDDAKEDLASELWRDAIDRGCLYTAPAA